MAYWSIQINSNCLLIRPILPRQGKSVEWSCPSFLCIFTRPNCLKMFTMPTCLNISTQSNFLNIFTQLNFLIIFTTSNLFPYFHSGKLFKNFNMTNLLKYSKIWEIFRSYESFWDNLIRPIFSRQSKSVERSNAEVSQSPDHPSRVAVSFEYQVTSFSLILSPANGSHIVAI